MLAVSSQANTRKLSIRGISCECAFYFIMFYFFALFRGLLPEGCHMFRFCLLRWGAWLGGWHAGVTASANIEVVLRRLAPLVEAWRSEILCMVHNLHNLCIILVCAIFVQGLCHPTHAIGVRPMIPSRFMPKAPHAPALASRTLGPARQWLSVPSHPRVWPPRSLFGPTGDS
ncbi:hypothetical protein VUR80DRAFT_6961 [Thermomyces stellatus]